MRVAFAAATRRDAARPDNRGWDLLAPYADKAAVTRAATTGSAFDYLFRFRLARAARERGTCSARQFRWVAEAGVDLVGSHGGQPANHARHVRHMAVAKRLVGDWVAGDDDAYTRVVDVTQWLARHDVWVRTDRRDFDRRGWVDGRVRKDLLQLDRILVAADPFAGAASLLLNPTFVGAPLTAGADADVVADDRVVELKTVGESAIKVSFLRQMAGYAVMQAFHGGIDLGDGTRHEAPFTHAGVYFARHGRYCEVSLEELFVPGGFDDYARTFEDEAVRQAMVAA